MRHGETTYEPPLEVLLTALLSDDPELVLVLAPLVETSEGCRKEACESEEACTCDQGDK